MTVPTELSSPPADPLPADLSASNIFALPGANALWREASDLAEDIHDLFRDADIPTPEVVEGLAYVWARESCADMRRALRLLRDAQAALERVQSREQPRQAAFDQRLRAMGIGP